MSEREVAAFQPELNLGADDRLMVVGTGFTGNDLYLRKFAALGVDNQNLALVDIDEGRLLSTSNTYPGAETYTDLDHALEQLAAEGKTIPAIFICSNTGAHLTNLRSIARAIERGLIDPEKTKIWSEKPFVPNESYDVAEGIASRAGMDISMGYILRVSGILDQLQEYVADGDYSLTALNWVYGKDRRNDPRVTQGVFPDEIVHPISVTELIVARSLGKVASIAVDHAEIKSEPFADPDGFTRPIRAWRTPSRKRKLVKIDTGSSAAVSSKR